MDTNKQIVNFVLNIALWQTVNKGYYHKMSIHIQDVISGFSIFWIIVDNGELSFEGVEVDESGHAINDKTVIRKASGIASEELDEVLKILKNINLFEP